LKSGSTSISFVWYFQKGFESLSFEYRDKGLTPEIPSNCPQKLAELMKMCWKKEPQQRPVSFLSSFPLHYISLFLFVIDLI
jgi:hypothetical protein